MTIGQRFRQERQRLQLGVADTAAICDVTRNAISRVEHDGSIPGGAVLQRLAQAGADAQYILTGTTTQPAIDWKAITALVEFRIAARNETLATADDVVEIVRGAMSLWQDINARNARVPMTAEQEATEANVRG